VYFQSYPRLGQSSLLMHVRAGLIIINNIMNIVIYILINDSFHFCMTADCAGLKYEVERKSNNMRVALNVSDSRLVMASRSSAPSPATRHCGRSHST